MSNKDSNTLIESLDKIIDKNNIIQKHNNRLKLKDINDDGNNKIIFATNLDINFIKMQSDSEIKSKRLKKFSLLSLAQSERNSERNELICNSNSITSNNLVKIKEKNNVSNNSKFIDSNIGEDNNSIENKEKDGLSKKVKKNLKKTKYNKIDTSYKMNKIPYEFNLETKSPNDIDLNGNKLVIKGYKKNEDNRNILKDRKLYIMNTIDINDHRNIKFKNNDYLNSYSNTNKKIPYFKCLFCDKIVNSKNNVYESYFTCRHYFCKKCGKKFYEDLIEIMIKTNNFYFLHCPIFGCTKEVSLSLLKIIISDKYYNELNKNIVKKYNTNEENNETILNNKNEKKIINIMGTEILDKNFINKNSEKTLNQESPKYLQNNIIDINTHKKYIYYIQKNFLRCPSCNEYSLYCKLEGNFDKCLKCMNKYCKFCHKAFDFSHFDVTLNTHCKVFYRTYKDFIQQKFYYKYLMNLLYVIGGYLFVLTFFLLKIKKAFKIRNFCLKLLAIIFYFVLFIISLPINLIILPYFPMIISL